MTRNGKIARLPQDIREELNERILNGQTAEQLLDWLHADDRVWEMLEAQGFDVITDGNISEWKAGGYQAWLENKEARELVVELALKSRDLGEETLAENLGQCVGNLLMVEFIKMMKILVQKEEDVPKRWAQLERVNRELARLRGSNAKDVWAGIQQKRSDWAAEDRDTAQEEKHAAWVKQQRLAEYRLRRAVAILAMDAKPENYEAAWYLAAREAEIEHDLPRGLLDREQVGGYWYWDEEDDQWRWMKKEVQADAKEEGKTPPKHRGTKKSRGKKANHPNPKIQTSSFKGKKARSSKSKVVEGPKNGGEKSAPTEVGDYEEKGNGSWVVTENRENVETPLEGTNFGRDAQNDPRDAGATPPPQGENEATVGVIPTNSDQLMGGGQEVEGRVTRVEGRKIAGKENGGLKVPAARANGNEDGGWQEKSAPTNPAGRDDYEEKGDGSSVASPHHEGIKASAESRPTELAGVKPHNNPPPGLWKLKSPNFYAQG